MPSESALIKGMVKLGLLPLVLKLSPGLNALGAISGRAKDGHSNDEIVGIYRSP